MGDILKQIGIKNDVNKAVNPVSSSLNQALGTTQDIAQMGINMATGATQSIQYIPYIIIGGLGLYILAQLNKK